MHKIFNLVNKFYFLFFFFLFYLEPITEYVISLRATNDAGDGQPAYANVRTTERSVSEFSAPLLPPVGLKASVLSDTTVVLYWTDTTLPKTQVYKYL